jgi:hypothetical protein
MLALVASHHHFLNAPVFHGGGVEDAFQQQGDVGLRHHLVVEQQVPKLPAPLRVVDGIIEAELLQQS